MQQKYFKFLALLAATVLSACSQPKADAIVQNNADAQQMEVPGLSIETKGDASTVVTNDENEVTITGNKAVQTRACTGQVVQVQGDDNQATFTGSCKELYLIGDRNTVVLANVTAIEVTGDNNTVRWRGTEPQVTNIGKGNTIAKTE